MSRVRPFRGLRYDTGVVDLSRVIVPPYDVVAADERAGFYERDPHSAIRLELTRESGDEATTDYSEVARTLAAWRREGVLRRDASPALYALRQRFRAPDGRLLAREGFFAELGLEDYAARVVRPHERTLAGPRADRLKLLRAAQANLSPVFLLYEDPEQALASLLTEALDGPGAESARDAAGVDYRLAPIVDPEASARVCDFLAPRPLVIADGHHRYESALRYRDERLAEAGADAAAPWQSTLVYLANAYAPGCLILPIHRVLRKADVPTDSAWDARLSGWQQRRVPLADPAQLAAQLEAELAPRAGQPAFAAADATGGLRIFWKPQPLGDVLVVRVVEDEVLGGVFGLSPEAVRDGAVNFPKSADRALLEVRRGEGSVALFLNPLAADDVFRVTGAGEVMPQKSTFFYPKVPSGLVFRVHDAAEGAA